MGSVGSRRRISYNGLDPVGAKGQAEGAGVEIGRGSGAWAGLVTGVAAGFTAGLPGFALFRACLFAAPFFIDFFADFFLAALFKADFLATAFFFLAVLFLANFLLIAFLLRMAFFFLPVLFLDLRFAAITTSYTRINVLKRTLPLATAYPGIVQPVGSATRGTGILQEFSQSIASKVALVFSRLHAWS